MRRSRERRGCSTPPPSRSWEIQRPRRPQGEGYVILILYFALYTKRLFVISLSAIVTAHGYFNLRPAGGGGVFEHRPPLRFFADSKKTAARSAAGFSPTLSPIFLATFVKVSILGHARSGHQVRSSDHTLQKLYNRAPATVFEGKL